MRNLLHHLSLFALLAAAAVGQTGGATGTLIGRITDDATGLALGSVRVVVVGTAVETYSTTNGSYTLLNVPAGEQTLILI